MAGSIAGRCLICASTIPKEKKWALAAGFMGYNEAESLFDVATGTVSRHLEHAFCNPDFDAKAFRMWVAREAKVPSNSTMGRRSKQLLNELDGMAAPSLEQIYNRMFELEQVALELMEQARLRDDPRGQLEALKAADSLLKRVSELSGFLSTAKNTYVVNVVGSPQWLGIQAQIMKALDEYPDAALSVAKALELPVGNVGFGDLALDAGYVDVEVVEVEE